MRAGFVITSVIVCGLIGGSSEVWAQDPIHKAGRGVVNVLTCWIELPKNIHFGPKEANTLLGDVWGLVRGTGLMATRLAVGAYEAVTFPIPYPKHFASPYEGLELPDYAWE